MSRSPAAALVLALLLVPVPPQLVMGQGSGETRTVSGRLLLGTPDGTRPVAGVHVVLHRIGPDTAGPVDSVRTARDGSYRFRYRWSGDSSLYIVSARYHGIAYFTAPLRQRDVASPDGDVLVFDTTSRPFPLEVRGRHFVLARGTGSVPRVFDVFEIANDSTLTLVAGSGGYTWETLLPSGALRPSAGGGDVPSQAVVFAEGRARVAAPFSPGIKQVVLSYELAGGTLSIPVDAPTGVLEVLLEEGTGSVLRRGPLQRQEDVSLEGRRFQRYLGQNVPRGSVVELTLAGGGFGRELTRLLPIALAAVVLVLGVAYGRRKLASQSVGPVPLSAYSTSELAGAVAAIDALRERPDADPALLAFLDSRRAELMAALRDALARGRGAG